jgi:hypothetical protein
MSAFDLLLLISVLAYEHLNHLFNGVERRLKRIVGTVKYGTPLLRAI